MPDNFRTHLSVLSSRPDSLATNLATPPQPLPRIAFFGRRLCDYEHFFGFHADELAGQRVLDVAAGSASFTAEATAHGLSVQAVDPLYRLQLHGVRERAKRDFSDMRAFVGSHPGRFNLQTPASEVDLWEKRRESMERFLLDYPSGVAAGRYRAESLPTLSFQDEAFDRIFCGHFLFLYAGHLSPEFHFKAILELLRLARESVTIYPLVTLEGIRYRQLESILSALRPQAQVRIESVSRPILKHATERLTLYPKETPFRAHPLLRQHRKKIQR